MLNTIRNWLKSAELDPMDDELMIEDFALADLPDGPTAVLVLVDGTMYDIEQDDAEEFAIKIDNIRHAMDTSTTFELHGETEEGRKYSEILRGDRVAHLFVA